MGSSDASVPEGSAAPGEIKDEAHRVVGQLKELGYRISPSSRFGQYLKIVEGCAASGTIGHPLLPQALLEFRQLDVITRVYGCLSGASAKLQRVISDPADPLKSKPEAPGRDTQFELFLGALLDLGGCAPLIGEPDLVFAHDGVAVGIAAKRVKSETTLRARNAGAIDQIENAAARGEIGRGVVALEATSLANPDGLVAITESEDLTSSAAAEQAARLGEGILASEIRSAMDDWPFAGFRVTA